MDSFKIYFFKSSLTAHRSQLTPITLGLHVQVPMVELQDTEPHLSQEHAEIIQRSF